MLSKIIRKKIKIKKVKIPEFRIVSNPTIRISDIKRRRFSILDRYRDWREVFSESIKNYKEEEDEESG